MDDAERLHQRQREIDQLVGVEQPVLARVILERQALDIFHDDIRRVVFLEVVDNVDDTLFIGKGGDVLRLEQKAIHALAEEILLIFGDNDFLGELAGAVRGAGGIELLDGDALGQCGMQTDVGDAEAALAQRLADEVPAREQRSGRQVIGLRLMGLAVVPSAVGAHGSVPELSHTIDTIVVIHRNSCFFLIGIPFPIGSW